MAALVLRSTAVAAIALGTALPLMAGFAEAFQAAKKRLEGKEYLDAHEAFAELANSAPNAHGEATSLSYAAIALGRHKQFVQAMELAQTIQVKPLAAYTQMEIMSANRKHRELIAAFKAESIDAWPDRINYRGLFLRGVAYGVTGDREAAVQDFEDCVELAGSDVWIRLEALNNVAVRYHALGDDAKAMAAYQKAFAIYDESPSRKGRWLYPQAILGATRILIGQQNHDEALTTLAKFSIKPRKDTRGSWDFLVLEAYGDVHLARGEKRAALAKYRDAMVIDTHKSYLGRVEKKVRELERDMDGEAK